MGTLGLYILLSMCTLFCLMPITYLWYRLLGVQVNAMTIGFGPLLFKAQLGVTRWELKALFFFGYSAELEGLAASMEEDQELDKSQWAPGDYRLLSLWRKFLLGLGNVIPLLLLASTFAGLAYPWACVIGFPGGVIDLVVEGGEASFWGPGVHHASMGFPHFLGIMASWGFAMQFFPFTGTFAGNSLTLILVDVFGMRQGGRAFEMLSFASMGLGMGLMLLLGLSLFGIL